MFSPSIYSGLCHAILPFRITLIFNQEKYFILLQVLIITVLIPILFFFLLRITGKIGSIMAPLVSERKIPLLVFFDYSVSSTKHNSRTLSRIALFF
jgi:hypothetical protein